MSSDKSGIMRYRGPSDPEFRRGIATVELAVCLPLLALLVFGSLQAANLIYLRHAVISAAYEGTLELSRPDATGDSITTRVEQVLAMHEVTSSKTTVSPGGDSLSKLPNGTPVRIRVRANVADNIALSGWFPLPNDVQCEAWGPN